MCTNPYTSGPLEYGCGQCLPCRINRRRVWSTRLMLEVTQHEASSFVTLTYAPEFYPADGCLRRRDVQLWLKRLRKAVAPHRIRYYAVGEYGEQTMRAHYHVALFGAGFNVGMHAQGQCDCLLCRSWPLGHVHVGELTVQSSDYIVGYLVKRMTKQGDPRLQGRVPEFSMMSTRPGIGFGAVSALGDVMVSRAGALSVAMSGDVSTRIRSDGQLRPIGRYLTRKLREAAGMDPGCPAAVSLQRSAEYWAEVAQPGGREKRKSRRVASGVAADARVLLAKSRRVL